MRLYKCQCRACRLADICGLLSGQYCSYYNCIVPPPYGE